jgi:hypothetical protein
LSGGFGSSGTELSFERKSESYSENLPGPPTRPRLDRIDPDSYTSDSAFIAELIRHIS